MKEFIIFHLFIISVISLPNEPPTKYQDADAVWLSNKIYDGVDTMDTDYGSVFQKHESKSFGAYAVWKQKITGECFVVIRGTKTLSDIFIDLSVTEYIDTEINVRVHSGVRIRTKFIIDDIGDKLGICTEDIIITGHSLGGSIAYYLYLLYVKRHLEDWNQKNKASRFKAVLFGTPALMTKSGKENIANFDNYVHWYKYGRDGIPFIIGKVKSSLLFRIISVLFKSIGINIAKEAYDIVKTVSYGYHHPGHKYHLSHGEKRDYSIMDRFGYDFDAIIDHMNLEPSVKILNKVWSKTNQFYNKNNTSKINYLKSLSEENKTNNLENSSNKYSIKINTADCEDVKDYVTMINFTNAVLYMKNQSNNATYIIKRLLDNEKEYEYAMCFDNKFILKQCNEKCKCHEVIKNKRPKEISHCNTYPYNNALNCLVDGNSKEIFVKEYFSVIEEIKIDKYYLMDYFCLNQTYSRGNYDDNSMKIMKTSISFLVLFLFLL